MVGNRRLKQGLDGGEQKVKRGTRRLKRGPDTGTRLTQGPGMYSEIIPRGECPPTP